MEIKRFFTIKCPCCEGPLVRSDTSQEMNEGTGQLMLFLSEVLAQIKASEVGEEIGEKLEVIEIEINRL